MLENLMIGRRKFLSSHNIRSHPQEGPTLAGPRACNLSTLGGSNVRLFGAYCTTEL